MLRIFLFRKCFDYLRPYFLELQTELAKNNSKPTNPSSDDVVSVATQSGKSGGGGQAKKPSNMNYEAITGRANDPVKQRYFDQSLINVPPSQTENTNPFDGNGTAPAGFQKINEQKNPAAETKNQSSFFKSLGFKKKEKPQTPLDPRYGSSESNLRKLSIYFNIIFTPSYPNKLNVFKH